MKLILHLNARLQPRDRFRLEDVLQNIFKKFDTGEVIGGGTSLMENGEIQSCDIEIDINQDKMDIDLLKKFLDQLGIPKGSSIQGIEPTIDVGTLEGLALYLNGTDLPKEVYENCDVNFVIEQLNKTIASIGSMYSFRELDEFTALYFYGTSYNIMKKKMETFISTYPLCRKCHIEQIA
jgi:hypothetical protein